MNLYCIRPFYDSVHIFGKDLKIVHSREARLTLKYLASNW